MENPHKPKRKFNWSKFFKITFGVIAALFICFSILILTLRWVNPPFTAFTLQEDWEEIGSERYNLRRHWVSDKELLYHLKLAVISSEDQRFRKHWGLDLKAIKNALEENQESEQRRGASTITQQVAKNLFLNSAQTYFRKGVEAGIAVLIELFWTKDRILEMYLNIAEFGPGKFGIGKASTDIFGKGAGNLTPDEAARLAAVLPSPKRMRPEPASPFVQQRSHWILLQMTHLSGNSYLPMHQELAGPDTSGLATSDTLSEGFSQPEIRRGTIPDSLILISEDPLLDSVMVDSLGIW
ncbi:MAG: monofunctional biosynthetic peptidoglycan transglycosylase [Balneolaceae bacterium]